MSEHKISPLLPSGCRMVSFVGGGGKTTCMLRLAEELAAEGRRVILTTTTHMADPSKGGTYPPDLPYVLREDEEAVRCALTGSGRVLVGLPSAEKPGRIRKVSDEFLDRLCGMADIVLVEADGARRKPVKVPKAWEPAVPPQTDVTFAVTGLGALGKKLTDICYDPEETAALLGTYPEAVLTEPVLAEILSRDDGLRKGAAGEYRVLLNQADTLALYRSGEQIREILGAGSIPADILSRRRRVTLILTASGLGRRFGGNKLTEILPDGKPMFLHVVEAVEGTKEEISRRIFVTGHEELHRIMEARDGWTVVWNAHPEEGISGSVRLGTAEAGETDAYLFSVCDQPGLKSESFDRLIRAWREETRGIVSACVNGRTVNPNLFSAFYRQELLDLTGDRGGSVIRRRHPEDVCPVELRDISEAQDIDTREQLKLYSGKTQ